MIFYSFKAIFFTFNQRQNYKNGSESSNSQKINFTGDNLIDADIAAFINARKRILNQMKRNFILFFNTSTSNSV
jgi:hypothetical protein